jgi:coiled-coil domain-containing protein 77
LTQPAENEGTYFREPKNFTPVEARGNAAAVAKSQLFREEQAKAISKRRGRGPPATSGNAQRVAGEGTAADFGLSDKDQVESLLLTIEALQAQMEDNTRLANEKETALTEDRRVREEEMRAVQVRKDECRLPVVTSPPSCFSYPLLLWEGARTCVCMCVNVCESVRESVSVCVCPRE